MTDRSLDELGKLFLETLAKRLESEDCPANVLDIARRFLADSGWEALAAPGGVADAVDGIAATLSKVRPFRKAGSDA